MSRRDIEFSAEGVVLRGWFYRAEGATGRAPTVVMAHGFSAVKEMYLDAFAEVFAAAGLNALVFDNRGFGASDGEPRQEIDPWQQVRDYRHAITPRSAPLLRRVDWPSRTGEARSAVVQRPAGAGLGAQPRASLGVPPAASSTRHGRKINVSVTSGSTKPIVGCAGARVAT